MKEIRKISIIGMGALGLMYADQITSGLNDMNAIEFIMDNDRVARHANDRYTVNGSVRQFKITDAAKAEPADLVMVAVKYPALPAALNTMKNLVGEDTIIMSVMNGVTSEKIIAERYGWKHMIHTVAQGMDAMRDGSGLKYTQCGKLHIGSIDRTNPAISKETDPAATAAKMAENLSAVIELFQRARVPHFVEKDIMYRMWFKYMLNIGINQTCMVYDTTYEVATTPGTPIYDNFTAVMREVIPAAKANGVTLTEADVMKCIEIERTLDPNGYPSMAQDRKARRKSEVDMFAGEMIAMSDKYGFAAPVNRYYYDRVMEIEAEY